MKWLTLDRIKDWLRIEQDFTAEDDLLEGIGEGAEETILNICNRTYEDLMETYGKVPASLMNASKMLCDIGYQYRNPVSPQSIAMVPYTFDILVKPYIRLADIVSNNENNNQYGCKNL